METSGVLPSRDPPDSVEVLYASERTRVTRLFLARRTVIRKEPLGRDAQRRLRQELAILERLRGITGVAQLVEQPQYPGSISLADVAGTSLTGMAMPLDADLLIRFGSALAGAVARMHSRLVMHHDITSANIVISRDGAPWLIDFALATTFAQVRPAFGKG
jgi:tRNA A-37 threonylcarbamoyl transferase component Bud32